jgi:hypothetical protein
MLTRTGVCVFVCMCECAHAHTDSSKVQKPLPIFLAPRIVWL